jgi:hypothetical protein
MSAPDFSGYQEPPYVQDARLKQVFQSAAEFAANVNSGLFCNASAKYAHTLHSPYCGVVAVRFVARFHMASKRVSNSAASVVSTS